MTNRLGTKSTQARLRRLMKAYDGTCQYCGCKVIRIAAIRPSNRLHQSAHFITYQTPKGKQTTAIATVEHVQRLADGGSNRFENLTLACSSCNAQRNNKHQQNRTDRVCHQCGEPVKKKRTCEKCHARMSRFFRPQSGGTPLGPLLEAALNECEVKA